MKRGNYLPWTNQDFAWLKANYATATDEALQARFPGRTLRAIRATANRLGPRRAPRQAVTPSQIRRMLLAQSHLAMRADQIADCRRRINAAATGCIAFAACSLLAPCTAPPLPSVLWERAAPGEAQRSRVGGLPRRSEAKPGGDAASETPAMETAS